MTTSEAVIAMDLPAYRLWWYEQVGINPPKEGERLTVAQENDERLIREGWCYWRRRRKQRHLPIKGGD